ncbi:hypothetical protein Tco_1239378 [Tanacetum coccineum]
MKEVARGTSQLVLVRSIQSHTNVDDNDEDKVQEIQRPEGRDKARAAGRKNKGSKSSASSSVNEDALARLMVTEMGAQEKEERLAFLEIKRREVAYFKAMEHGGFFYITTAKSGVNSHLKKDVDNVPFINTFDALKDTYASNDVGSIMDDSDSEEVKNVFVEDNGKPMDCLVNDARKKVEDPPKKTHRKTGIWLGRKVDSPKRNVIFSPEPKIHYLIWMVRKWSMKMPLAKMVDGLHMVIGFC